MTQKKMKELGTLSHVRSLTKKQLKEERNQKRKSWEGCRSTKMLTEKDKHAKSDRQKTKSQLKTLCY